MIFSQGNFTRDTDNTGIISCNHTCSDFRLRDILTNLGEVKRLFLNLYKYKSCGPDNVSPMLLNLAADSLAQPFAKLFNLSLATGVIPLEWKLANIVPLFKSGDAHIMANYRPISLCSVVGKVLERIVSNHLTNHMYRGGGIISPTQHGFLPKRSCVTQLSTLYLS